MIRTHVAPLFKRQQPTLPRGKLQQYIRLKSTVYLFCEHGYTGVSYRIYGCRSRYMVIVARGTYQNRWRYISLVTIVFVAQGIRIYRFRLWFKVVTHSLIWLMLMICTTDFNDLYRCHWLYIWLSLTIYIYIDPMTRCRDLDKVSWPWHAVTWQCVQHW